MRLVFEITGGPAIGQKTWLRPGDSLTVGRTERSDMAIAEDKAMSSMHFVVENEQTVCRIRDMGSTNGTYVNGTRVVESELKHGDIILAGQTEFVVSIDSTTSVARNAGHAGSVSNETIRPQARPTKPVAQNSGSTRHEAVKPDLRGETTANERMLSPKSRPNAQPGETAHAKQEDNPFELLTIANDSPFPTATIPWENARGEGRLTVVLKATISLESTPRPAESQLPLLTADQPFDQNDVSLVRLEADLVPFKPRADIVVVGHVHAPGQRPVSQLDARLRVGRLTKTIRVFGDRIWSFPTAMQLVPRMSKPEPFTAMEITYARAFGGIDEHAARYCAENLAGVGFIGELTSKSIHKKSLPNFEDPNQLIVDWETHPKPQGFGFYGRGWMPRLGFAGTFDEEYLKNRSPLPPENASYEVYNGAHPDLQLDGYLRGDEEIELDNLSMKGKLRFQLPGFRPQIRLTRLPPPVGKQTTTPPAVEGSVVPALDTLVLLPDEDICYLVYRAVFAVPSLEEIDIGRIHIACDG